MGYTEEADPHATAFFPLHPLLVRAVAAFGLDETAAGMVVTTVATVVACAYLHRLAEEELGGGAGRRAVLYLTLFPTAVFLVASYSEALFLAGAVPAFYYARRGRWHLVALPAAVAMGARFAGVFLLVGLVVELLSREALAAARRVAAVGAIAAGLVPLAAYSAYLWASRGDPFYFATDQRLGWGRELVGPVRSFLNTWNTWAGADYPTNWRFAWRVEIVAAVAGVGLVVWAVTKREWGYAAFMGTFLATLMVSSWYYSIPRMLLSMFPVVLFLAEATRRRAEAHDYVLAVFAPLCALGVVVFTQGAWFY